MASAHRTSSLKRCSQYGFLFIVVILWGTACNRSLAHEAEVTAFPDDRPTSAPSIADLPPGSAPEGWENLQSDPFDRNINGWPDDQRFTNGESYLDVAIRGGKYEWTQYTLTGSFFFLYPQMDDVKDVIVWVDATCVECKPQWDYGIVLHVTDGGWLYFSVNEEGTVRFMEFQERMWMEMIQPVTASAFMPGQTNRLGLISEGEQVSLFINQEEVAKATISWLEAGKVGLAASQVETGEMKVAFDNWELHRKINP